MKQITSLADILPDRRNANKGTARGSAMLEQSLRKYGAGRSIVVDRDAETIGGAKTLEAAAAIGLPVRVIQSDGKELIVVQRTDLDLDTDTEARELAIADNRIGEASLSWDTAVLADLGADIDLSAFWTKDELAGLLVEDVSLGGGGDTSDDIPDLAMPDALFPTDNEWGIPTLDLKMQAQAVDVPIERWGRMARHGSIHMGGTWHFYTDDYKFQALWDDPAPVPASGCINAVEPNWSTYPAMPSAVALYRIYQKRYMARWWQMSGVRMLVDLNVEPQFDALNLIGVPPGWRAYATRAYSSMLDDVTRHFDIACTHAGIDDLLFVVMGGGKAIQQMCGDRGWVWIPQENHVVEGRYG